MSVQTMIEALEQIAVDPEVSPETRVQAASQAIIFYNNLK